MAQFLNFRTDRGATGRLSTRRRHRALFAVFILIGLAATRFQALAVSADSKIEYIRDVRPILQENCFPCHGPDSAARKASLRLDKFAESTANRGGYAAIVKGDPAKSEL